MARVRREGQGGGLPLTNSAVSQTDSPCQAPDLSARCHVEFGCDLQLIYFGRVNTSNVTGPHD